MSESTPTVPVRPRLRFGAIAWELIAATIAITTLAATADAERRADVAAWFADLTPGGVALLAVLGAGALLLVLGLLAVVRGVQRRRERPADSLQ